PERLRECVGGIVDHHVETTEFVDGALHQSAKGVDVTEMRRHPDGLAAEPAQALRGLLAGVGFAAGNHDAGRRPERTPPPTPSRFLWVPPVTMTVRPVMSKR